MRVPLGQGSHVKLLLNVNYQTQLFSGKDNSYLPLGISREMQQHMREPSLDESETDSQVYMSIKDRCYESKSSKVSNHETTTVRVNK